MTTTIRSVRTWWPAALLCALVAGAYALRVWLTYAGVFGPDGIVFLDTDAWYHMRLVDSLIVNYPHRIWFDPYLLPGGEFTQVAPLFDWLIASTALVIGGGHPSPYQVDVVGAYTPAFVGALTTVPIYFLGRELFTRRAGLFAAAIIGVLPGEVLLRSLVGFTDHHCLETLLSATTLMFVTFALRPARASRNTILYTTLTGLSLSAYLLSWSGGVFLIAVLGTYGVGYVVLARLRNADAPGVVGILTGAFVIAALMILPWVDTTRSFREQAVGLAVGLLAFSLIWVWGRIARARVAYAAGLLLLAVGASAGAMLLARPVLVHFLNLLREVSPNRGATVTEATPLLRSGPHPLWSQFTTSFYLALPALAVVIRDVFRRTTASRTLFLVWTAATVVATIGQVRFSYYLAISVAVLAGSSTDVVIVGISERRAAAVAGAVMAALVVLPNVPAFIRIHGGRPVPPESEAYAWLRENTPQPFRDADAYYRVFQPPAPNVSPPPRAAYAVLASWWRGYSMIRTAHRVPNANGTQAGSRDVASFLLAENEDRARQVLDRLNTRYVMTDWLMIEPPPEQPSPGTQFYSLALTAGRSPTEYRDVFYQRTPAGQLVPVVRYYPSYYRSMATRLHAFGGAAAQPLDSTFVVSFSDRQEGGRTIKEITTEQQFLRYEDAVAFVDAAKSDHVRLVGRDPFVTPVPLPALNDFAPVYRFPIGPAIVNQPGRPTVRVFEYRRWKARDE